MGRVNLVFLYFKIISMKNPHSPVRSPQSLIIPEGFYNEAYTPKAGRVTSTSLGGKELSYCKIHLSDDANVTGRDAMGNPVIAQPHKAGPVPYLWTEISNISAGSVWIVHDGILYPDKELAAMNYPVHNNAIAQ